MAKLRHVVAGDNATFHDRCLAPLVDVAGLIHRLPDRASGARVDPCELFRRCLEIAVHARQAAEGRLFTPRCGAEARHAMEPRWRHAAFVAGLLCELPREMVGASQRSPIGGVDLGIDTAVIAALQASVSAATASWFDAGPRPLMAELHEVLCALSCDVQGAVGASSALADVVRDTRRRVVGAAVRHDRAPAVTAPAGRTGATDPNGVEPWAGSLSAEEVALAAQWASHLADGRTDRVVRLPGPSLAVCAEACGPVEGHLRATTALAQVAAVLQRRRWLGRGDWPAAGAPVGLLRFGSVRKPGLVVNAVGLAALGLLHR